MVRTEYHRQLDTLRGDVLRLGDLTVTALRRAIGALQEDDREAAGAIVAADEAIDERHALIQREAITTLATQQPTAGDLRDVIAALNIAGELERVGDYAAGTAALVLRSAGEPPVPPFDDLYQMARTAVGMLEQSLAAYRARDAALARYIWNEDLAVDAYQQVLYRTLLAWMMENPSSLTRATHLLWTVHKLERVADRATNICEQVIFMIDGYWPDFRTLPARSTPPAHGRRAGRGRRGSGSPPKRRPPRSVYVVDRAAILYRYTWGTRRKGVPPGTAPAGPLFAIVGAGTLRRP
jgi:phosphate transport system protein